MPSSARTPTSASKCRSRCPGSTAQSSIPGARGPTLRNMTRRRPSWSTCSSRISRSSLRMWTRASDNRVRSERNNHKRSPPHRPLQLRPDRRSGLPRTRSMTEYRPRTFRSDAEIKHIGEGLVARTLPRPEWTHEAHLAATSYLLVRRPDIDLDKELPDIIRRYNESVGGVNDDTQGYHETITRMFLLGVRLFLAEADLSEP